MAVGSEHSDSSVSLQGLAALRACSINHRSCGLPLLSEMSAGADAATALHATLTSLGIASVVLATCNRTEMYWRATAPGHDALAMEALAEAVGASPSTLAERSLNLSGDAAADHLFRVCCGLESLVLGEAEILGQVRAALESCTGAGPWITGVVRAAIRTGRAARAETGIGTGALSVASTAIHWLSECLPLRERRVLLIGAGKTCEKAARHLKAVGVGSLVIANRTRSHADELAARVGAEAIGLESLQEEIDRVDAVISAVNAPAWVLTLDQIRHRATVRTTPIVVVDLSMPPSVEPGTCDGLNRVDLASLEESARAHRDQRESEIPAVEDVIAR